MRLLLLIFFSVILYANTDTPRDDVTQRLEDSFLTPSQTSHGKSSFNDKSVVNQVFSSSYIEDVITGFIDTLERTLLEIDIRRVSIDFSNTSISVSDEYRNLGINQFSGDNATVANFVSDFALEYNFTNSRLANTLYAEYGMIILSPKYKTTTRTETADTLIVGTGYTRKSFFFDYGFLGPFIDGEYQTEFTKRNNGLRNQYLRYKVGMRFLDGKYIDELHIAGVGEYDLSYKPSSIKGAVELGIRVYSPVNDNIRFVYQGFIRQYVGYSIFRSSDLLYNLNLNVRLDVNINSGFAFSPFISARFARIKGSSTNASNIVTGVSLLFSSTINAVSNIKGKQDARLREYYKSIQ